MIIRLASYFALALLLGPVLISCVSLALPAFGYWPALGYQSMGFAAFHSVLEMPGIARSIGLSLGVGLFSTFLAFALSQLFFAAWYQTRAFSIFQRLLSPLLALPHAAAAFALAFMIAPSGWIFRAAAATTGWPQSPPDLLIVNDTWGLAMTTGLVVKEIPFLFLMTLAAVSQIRVTALRASGQSLGYPPFITWVKLIFPLIYQRIRLPVFAVIAYSSSVVDVALILGPTTPPPLAVRIIEWLGDPDLSMRLTAAAACIFQIATTAAALLLWVGLEKMVRAFGALWLATGHRGSPALLVRWVTLGAVTTLLAAVGAGLLAIALWSVARSWRFPDFLPATYSLRNWQRHGERLIDLFFTSVAIGLAAILITILVTVLCLERETREKLKTSNAILWVLYAPLLMPQIALLFGVQIIMLQVNVAGTWGAVVFVHCLFVLPYIFLSLQDPWRNFDTRFLHQASAFGKTALTALIRVRLPMMIAPLCTALAVGFAVSISQYLPTLLIGGGRVTTITTEAIAISSGANRRLISIYALLQMLLPMIAFALAILIPRVLAVRRG